MVREYLLTRWRPYDRRARVKRIWAVLTCCALYGLVSSPCGSAAAAEDEGTTVARVNGTPITASQVREIVKSVIASSPKPPGGEALVRLTEEALASLIDLELLYQEALAREIWVTPDEVEAEISRNRNRFPSEDDFRRALQRSDLSEERLRRATRKTLLVNRLLETVVWQDVAVTPKAAREFFEAHRAELKASGGATTFAAVRDRIVHMLERSRKQARKEAFVGELRKKASIETRQDSAP